MKLSVVARPVTAERPPAYTLLVRLTSWLLLAFLALIAFGSLTTMDDPGFTPALRVTGTIINTLVAVGFVVLQGQLLRSSHHRTTTLLSWAVILLGLTLVPVSNTWSMLGIAVATAMLMTSRAVSLLLGLGVWLIGVVEVALDSGALVNRLGIPLAVLLTAVLQVTLTRLTVALTEAHVAREQLARLQVDDERHRISRDLHDIIGRTLVAASLRNEAAQQLLDRDVERAREQLVEVHEAIARGQAQLRRLTTGPVIADLADELTSSQALCTRLGITCRVDAEHVDDGPIAMLAARIVREAVTNMLRHSTPRVCLINVHRGAAATTVSVVNDGAAASAVRPARGGTGTADLQTRVEAAGGAFEAGPLNDERYRVWARLPVSLTGPEGSS